MLRASPADPPPAQVGSQRLAQARLPTNLLNTHTQPITYTFTSKSYFFVFCPKLFFEHLRTPLQTSTLCCQCEPTVLRDVQFLRVSWMPLPHMYSGAPVRLPHGSAPARLSLALSGASILRRYTQQVIICLGIASSSMRAMRPSHAIWRLWTYTSMVGIWRSSSSLAVEMLARHCR